MWSPMTQSINALLQRGKSEGSSGGAVVIMAPGHHVPPPKSTPQASSGGPTARRDPPELRVSSSRDNIGPRQRQLQPTTTAY